jgi:hypothetical protein
MKYKRIIAAAPDDYYVYRKRGGKTTVERRQRTPEQLRKIYENTKARLASGWPSPVLAEHYPLKPLGKLVDIEFVEKDNKQAIEAEFDCSDDDYCKLLDDENIWTSPMIMRNDFIGVEGSAERGDYIKELSLTKEPASRNWNEPERLSKGVIETHNEGEDMASEESGLWERIVNSFTAREVTDLKETLEAKEAELAEKAEALSKATEELKTVKKEAEALKAAEAERAEENFAADLKAKGYSPAQVEKLSKRMGEILEDETWLEVIEPADLPREPLSQQTTAPTDPGEGESVKRLNEAIAAAAQK